MDVVQCAYGSARDEEPANILVYWVRAPNIYFHKPKKFLHRQSFKICIFCNDGKPILNLKTCPKNALLLKTPVSLYVFPREIPEAKPHVNWPDESR
jgi:hypothetical protein